MQEVWRVQLLEATGLGWDKKKKDRTESMQMQHLMIGEAVRLVMMS